MKRISLLVAALALPMPVAAQFDNPEGRIQELSEQISSELQEIDTLLLQTSSAGKASAAADAMKQTAKRMNDLLEQTSKSQGAAVQRIDELIKEVEKLSGT